MPNQNTKKVETCRSKSIIKITFLNSELANVHGVFIIIDNEISCVPSATCLVIVRALVDCCDSGGGVVEGPRANSLTKTNIFADVAVAAVVFRCRRGNEINNIKNIIIIIIIVYTVI